MRAPAASNPLGAGQEAPTERSDCTETRFTANKAAKPSFQHVLRHPIKPTVALGDYRRGKQPDQLPAQTRASVFASAAPSRALPDQLPAQARASVAIMGRGQIETAELEGFRNQSL